MLRVLYEMRGGRTYGTGAHGTTFDAALPKGRERPSATCETSTTGCESLSQWLEAQRDITGDRVDVTFFGLASKGGRGIVVRETDGKAGERLRARLSLPDARDMVVKSFHHPRSAPAEFREEMKALSAVARAYGPAACRRLTTIGSMSIGTGRIRRGRIHEIDFTGAIVRDARDGRALGHFVLSRKCAATLKQYEFKEDRDLRDLVTQVLESLARLHAGGVMHCDVKGDNVMACPSDRDGDRDGDRDKADRFRLIDWGQAIKTVDLRRMYSSWSPEKLQKPFASPLSFVASGLPDLAAEAVFAYRVTGICPALLTSARGRTVLLGIGASFEERMEGERRLGESHAVIRARLLGEAPCFDLFSFGLTLYQTCEGARLSPGCRSWAVDVARRLTHVSASDRFRSASEASKWSRLALPPPVVGVIGAGRAGRGRRASSGG